MSWERELHVLEEAIRRLNAEYDAFLYAATPKAPPAESRKHVEQMIRQLGGESPDSAADRFRFQTLQGRFNALCERWERLQLEKESGRRPGLYGHFAPERSGGRGPGGADGAGRLNAVPAVAVERGPDSDAERQLYERYVAARKARGEKVDGYVFERFVESLDRERRKLAERLGTSDIVFDVTERDGKVKLIARRSGGPGAPGAARK